VNGTTQSFIRLMPKRPIARVHIRVHRWGEWTFCTNVLVGFAGRCHVVLNRLRAVIVIIDVHEDAFEMNE